MTETSFEQIRENVKKVRHNIAEAAIKAGRSPEDITLVGVTKTQPAAAVRAVIEAGVDVIGENRVQELLDKEPQLANLPHKTHLIGHLQRNKAKYLPGHIGMLQSLDSPKTADALEAAYAGHGSSLDVLIEVNIAKEQSKAGVAVQELPALVAHLQQCPHLKLQGLMAIPPFGLGEGIRRYFSQMFQLFVDMQHEKMDNNTVDVLSMGMSADYGWAIQEGATMVRVGTELFGPRSY